MRAQPLRWLLCLMMLASVACKENPQEASLQSEAIPNVFPERAAALLRNAETLQVLSLDPGISAETGGFHDWTVLGTVSIPDTDRKTLTEAVIASVAPPNVPVAGCFNPRHGIHAVAKDVNVDLVICFECNNVHVYYSDGGRDGFIPSQRLEMPLSKILTDAGIPIALTLDERIKRGS